MTRDELIAKLQEMPENVEVRFLSTDDSEQSDLGIESVTDEGSYIFLS